MELRIAHICTSREQGGARGWEQGTGGTGSNLGLLREMDRNPPLRGPWPTSKGLSHLPTQPAFGYCWPLVGAEGLGCLGVNCFIT